MNQEYFKCEMHLFEKDSYYCFSVKHGNVYQVDEVTYNLLKYCDHNTYQELEQFFNENNYGTSDEFDELLQELCELELLKSESVPDKGNKMELLGMPTEQSAVCHIALHISQDCNLRCLYCYGDGGCYGAERTYMSEEVALKAVDFLVDYSGKSKDLSIIYFGGEPLLNFDLIKKVTKYVRKVELETNKRFKLNMTTNGTLIDDEEVLNFLDENKIGITLSMDGTKEYHDRYRVFEDGTGSYDIMMQGTEKLLKRRNGKVTARMTIGKHNVKFSEISKEVGKLGFKTVLFSFASVDDDSMLKLKEDDFKVIEEEYKKAAEDTIQSLIEKKVFTPLNIFEEHIYKIHEKRYVVYQCGGGRSYLSVTPSGGIFVCHRFAEDKNFQMGNVYDGLEDDSQKSYIHANVEERSDCSNCWGRYICGGGCYYESVHNAGSLDKVNQDFCKVYKKYFEYCIHIYHKVKSITPDFWDDYYKNYRKKVDNSVLK